MMQSNVSWVVASYALTIVALAGYVLYLRARTRDAERALGPDSGDRE